MGRAGRVYENNPHQEIHVKKEGEMPVWNTWDTEYEEESAEDSTLSLCRGKEKGAVRGVPLRGERMERRNSGSNPVATEKATPWISP